MSFAPEEILEEFAEASELGTQYRRAADRLEKDLHVVGPAERMPWGDDSNFEAWCREQEPIVRRALARAIGERAERAGTRMSLSAEERRQRNLEQQRTKWASIPPEVRRARARKYKAHRREREDTVIRALRAARPIIPAPPPVENSYVTCAACGGVNELRAGMTHPLKGWCCGAMAPRRG